MNYFVILGGLTYLGAAVTSALRGHYLWAILWALYSAANFVAALLEARRG